MKHTVLKLYHGKIHPRKDTSTDYIVDCSWFHRHMCVRKQFENNFDELRLHRSYSWGWGWLQLGIVHVEHIDHYWCVRSQGHIDILQVCIGNDSCYYFVLRRKVHNLERIARKLRWGYGTLKILLSQEYCSRKLTMVENYSLVKCDDNLDYRW